MHSIMVPPSDNSTASLSCRALVHKQTNMNMIRLSWMQEWPCNYGDPVTGPVCWQSHLAQQQQGVQTPPLEDECAANNGDHCRDHDVCIPRHLTLHVAHLCTDAQHITARHKPRLHCLHQTDCLRKQATASLHMKKAGSGGVVPALHVQFLLEGQLNRYKPPLEKHDIARQMYRGDH